MLLHGFTGSPESWDEVVRASPSWHFVTPALLGHGASGGAARTWDDEIERLAALARRERVSLLVGYSLGGRIALGLLAAHPELFARAIVVSASPGLPGNDGEARDVRRTADEAQARALVAHGVRAFVDAWEDQPLFASQRELPADVRARRRDVRLAHSAEGLASSLRTLGLAAMPDLAPRLREVPTPTTLVAGENDPRFVEHAARLAAAMPHACHVVVEGAGHDVVLERPAAIAALMDGEGSR